MKLKKKYSIMANTMLIAIMVGLYSIWLISMVSHKETEPKVQYIKLYKPYFVHDTTYISRDKRKESKTLEYVEHELKSLNIRFVDIVVAQAIIESSSFKSEICIKANNCFGMKLAKQRPTTAIGEYKGYAKYKSLRDCLIDYALWQQDNISGINTNKEYLKLLERIYAEDKNYTNKLKNIQ